jgi:quercetin dioxygenase-like cupin family protein
MQHFLDWREHAGSQPEKFYKSTLWQGDHMMVGVNCLEPGQEQKVHAHANADKFYYVLQGEATFTIGDERRDIPAGMVALAPAGIPHGVTNNSDHRLSLLVAISPPIK